MQRVLKVVRRTCRLADLVYDLDPANAGSRAQTGPRERREPDRARNHQFRGARSPRGVV